MIFASNQGIGIQEFNTSTITLSENNYCTYQFLDDPTFDTNDNSWCYQFDGDYSDVTATINEGQANFEILGTHGTINFTENPNKDLWSVVNNSLYPSLPDIYNITEEGWYVSHFWEDNDPQNPCIEWERNITIPFDISDYIITSASISAIVNATVEAYPGSPNGGSGVDVQGDDVENYDLYDYFRCYILLSDPNKTYLPYEIAYYQSSDIGRDTAGEYDYLPDTNMLTISQESLIFYLNQVLKNDGQNFTISIGIRFWCEDNFKHYDEDNWESILVKNLSLVFTYEKKIDQFTSISLEQEKIKVSELSNYEIEIVDARLNFRYKVSDDLASYSPNSEIRLLINDIQFPESIKLSDYASYPEFQYAKDEGFDIKSLIPLNENLTLSISLYLADEFKLDKVIVVSIDDIYLNLSYIEYLPSYEVSATTFWIIISILLVALSILSALSVRSYVLEPRKKRKETFLILQTQKFKDIRNIQAIILMHKSSGLPIFTQNYSTLLKGKNTLFSGFIQAISIIGEEISRGKGPKIEKIKPNNKISVQKVIELDLKQFHCLILDIEELRCVLILKDKSSKRLKQLMLHFTLELYLKISDQLENWKNDLNYYTNVIPSIINEYFELRYKNYFKMSNAEQDIHNLKKKYKLSRIQCRVLNSIQTLLKDKKYFRIMDIIENFSEKSENEIIFTIESLIEQSLIVPLSA
jgi:hypothetical protein